MCNSDAHQMLNLHHGHLYLPMELFQVIGRTAVTSSVPLEKFAEIVISCPADSQEFVRFA